MTYLEHQILRIFFPDLSETDLLKRGEVWQAKTIGAEIEMLRKENRALKRALKVAEKSRQLDFFVASKNDDGTPSTHGR